MKTMPDKMLGCLIASNLVLCGWSTLPVQAACDEYRPYEQKPTTSLRRFFDPRENDVSLVINGLPIRYRAIDTDEYDALEERLKTRLENLKVPRKARKERIVLMEVTLNELEHVKRTLKELNSPYLEIKTESTCGKVYYVPLATESNVDELNIADVLDALGYIYYKKGQLQQAQEELAEATRLKGRHFGQHSLQVAEAQEILAMAYLAHGDLNNAMECYLVAFDITKTKLADNSQKIADMAQHIVDVEREARACGVKLDRRSGNETISDAERIEQSDRLASRNCPRCVPTHINPAPIVVLPQVQLIAENAMVAAEEQCDQQSGEATQLKSVLTMLLKQQRRSLATSDEDD